MLKIAICEKNQEIVTRAGDYLERYEKERGTETEVLVFTKGSEFIENQQKVDVAIINVELQDEGGVDVVLSLRETNKKMPVAFITSQPTFSFKGYDVDAVDFLAFPFSYYAFSTLLDRMQLRLIKTDIPYIAIMTKKGVQRVSVDRIEYIEAVLNHVVYHTTDGDIRAQGSLNDEAKKVTADRFFRLGGYLINLAHVNKVWETDVYVGKACLPLPHKQKNALLNSLVAFMNRG